MFAAQVIDLRFKKHSLVSICLEETGGLGIDCIIDNGGMTLCENLKHMLRRVRCKLGNRDF